MAPFYVGPTLVGEEVKVIGVLDRPYSLAYLDQLYREGLTLLEVRLDLFEGPLHDALNYVAQVAQLRRFGLLGTLRETPDNVFIRPALFEKFLAHVDMVDVEVDTPIREAVVALARKAGKKVLVSEHRFEGVPDESGLNAMFESALRLSPDLFKLAALVQSSEDLVRLLSFCHRCNATLPSCVLGMGPLGKPSRMVGGLFGSALTYGYLGDVPVAPGQLSAQALLLFLKQLNRTLA